MGDLVRRAGTMEGWRRAAAARSGRAPRHSLVHQNDTDVITERKSRSCIRLFEPPPQNRV